MAIGTAGEANAIGSVLDLLFNPNKKQRARRTGIMGIGGMGKSTLANKWPEPRTIQTEDGLQDIEGAIAWPIITHLGNMKTGQRTSNGLSLAEIINGLASAPSLPFRSLVIDTVDGLHKFVELHVEANYTDKERSFGKDSGLLADVWRQILNALEWLNIRRNLEIVLLSHVQISKFNDPLGDAYNYYAPRLPEKCSALLVEWSDEWFFYNHQTMVVQKEEGFKKTRAVAAESGVRALFSVERPGYVAKSRLRGLPEVIEVHPHSTYHDLIGQYLPAAPVVPILNVAG